MLITTQSNCLDRVWWVYEALVYQWYLLNL